ncbi:hypothetical protein SEA_RIMA_26 [Streptomyces phage Rima]|uniref:Uncharacterized protein n=15 Tax=Rimavirus rima TaxID=2560784 RepID=A0A1I9SDQ3_9CAUD|nr:hypothetical protein FDH06_gp26 [Streptomyces phage Rima]AOZ64980.1 hypothetical protein SEA_RIMA_26 [Streptomyces phage Rima]
MYMAEGDQALAANFPVVPETGEEGRVRWGAREINRTRDFIAQVKALIPTGKAGFRTAGGISSGTADPTGGNDGDIYFKIIS